MTLRPVSQLSPEEIAHYIARVEVALTRDDGANFSMAISALEEGRKRQEERVLGRISVLDIGCHDAGLPNRLANDLERFLGVIRVSDLMECTREDFASIPGIGAKSLSRIESFMDRYGLSFKGDGDEPQGEG